jgi:hypothetical protein
MDTGPDATVGQLYGEGSGPFGSPAEMVGTAVFSDGSFGDAKAAYAILASPSFQACWLSTLDQVTTSLTTGAAALTSPSVSSLATPTVGSGAQSSGFAMRRTLSIFGTTVTTDTTVTAIQFGSYLAMLIAEATNQTFPDQLRVSIAQEIARRMGAPPPKGSTSSSSPATGCTRSGIPHSSQPILTDKQVSALVHAKATFEGETTNGVSICVWTAPVRQNLPGGLRVTTTRVTWQVEIDGPLSSAAAATSVYESAARASRTPLTPVKHLGDAAGFVSEPSIPARLIVRVKSYYLAFTTQSQALLPTQRLNLLALATAVLVRLGFSPPSPRTVVLRHWSTDWAGRPFCRKYHQPFLAIWRGVAACGVPYTGPSSNTTGPTSYGKVTFDTTGFQCVELIERYLYFRTGVPGPWANGAPLAWQIYKHLHKSLPALGVVPWGSGRSTSGYRPSLGAKGVIVSMWGGASGEGAFTAGHVAVVINASVHKVHGTYTGKITVLNQNATPPGIDHIVVKHGKMTFLTGFFTDFQWLTGLPST